MAKQQQSNHCGLNMKFVLVISLLWLIYFLLHLSVMVFFLLSCQSDFNLKDVFSVSWHSVPVQIVLGGVHLQHSTELFHAAAAEHLSFSTRCWCSPFICQMSQTVSEVRTQSVTGTRRSPPKWRGSTAWKRHEELAGKPAEEGTVLTINLWHDLVWGVRGKTAKRQKNWGL